LVVIIQVQDVVALWGIKIDALLLLSFTAGYDVLLVL